MEKYTVLICTYCAKICEAERINNGRTSGIVLSSFEYVSKCCGETMINASTNRTIDPKILENEHAENYHS